MTTVFGLLTLGFAVAFGAIPTATPLRAAVGVLVAIVFTALWWRADGTQTPDGAETGEQVPAARHHQVVDRTKRPGDEHDGYEVKS